MKGLDKFKGHAYPDVRIIAGLYYNPNQVIARADSNVSRLQDFKGKVFAPGVAGGTTHRRNAGHFAPPASSIPATSRPSTSAPLKPATSCATKQLDGTWIMAGLPNAGVSEMCATADGRLVNIDDATFANLSKDYPWYARFQIPRARIPIRISRADHGRQDGAHHRRLDSRRRDL